MKKKPQAKDLLFYIMGLLALTLVLLLAFEGILRLVGMKPQKALLSAKSPFVLLSSTLWGMKKNYKGKWSDVSFRTNLFGLRDDDFSQKPPPKEFRLLVLGDSVTVGYNVERSKIFIDRLEKNLNQKKFPSPWKSQIINAGIPGYGTSEELFFLKESGLLFEPNMIILAFVLNDIADKRSKIMRKLKRKEKMSNGVGVVPRARADEKNVWQKMLTSLRGTAFNSVARRLRIKIFSKQLVRKQEKMRHLLLEEVLNENPSPLTQMAWNEAQNELLEISQIAKKNKIPFFLVLFPVKEQMFSLIGNDFPQRKLIQLAKENDIPYLNLLPTFRSEIKAGFSAGALFLDDVHLTSFGHEIVAKRITKELSLFISQKLFL